MTKVLITVKTYPSASKKYKETVCTAGMLENGSWVRIYPLTMRSQKDYKEIFPKYRWINIDLVHYSKDFRPETRRPKDVDNLNIQPLEQLGTKNKWRARRDIVLKKPHYTSLNKLISDAYDSSKNVSLAVFQPERITGMVHEVAKPKEYSLQKQAALKQADIFQDQSRTVESLPPLPYNFKYQLVDDQGKKIRNDGTRLGAGGIILEFFKES